MQHATKEFLVHISGKGYYSYINYNPDRLAKDNDFFFKDVPSNFHFMTYEEVKKVMPYLRQKYGQGDLKLEGVLVLRLSEDF